MLVERYANDLFPGPAIAARIEMIQMVRKALEDGRAVLAFQPVMHAQRPDVPAFHEGLIRLLDEAGRVIPACDFIELVEDHDIGRMLDCKALELGLQALAADPALRLSVNISARTIGQQVWIDTLERGLDGNQMLAERLIVEITETSAMTMPMMVATFISALRLRGISFALDDFGAGNTSFRHLRRFRFDIVKLDGTFSGNVHADPDNQALVHALISIGRHFEMMIVSEAVETEDEAAWLTNAGIDALQGYHFGAPALRPTRRKAPEPTRAC